MSATLAKAKLKTEKYNRLKLRGGQAHDHNEILKLLLYLHAVYKH
jgi:hypothetical protein